MKTEYEIISSTIKSIRRMGVLDAEAHLKGGFGYRVVWHNDLCQTAWYRLPGEAWAEAFERIRRAKCKPQTSETNLV